MGLHHSGNYQLGMDAAGMKSAEWKGTPQEAVQIIKAAIIVDEGIKVTVEAEKAE